MLIAILTLILWAILFAASRWWWRSHLNPVTIGLLAWLPALVLINFPPFFLSPYYIHLNRPIAFAVYVALALAFVSFWVGCATAKAFGDWGLGSDGKLRVLTLISLPRALLLYALGLVIFVYGYISSGLLDLPNLDQFQVAESRTNLHLGWISFLSLFMDSVAIVLFARMFQTGKKLYALPMLLALACQAATLQKSSTVFLLVACVFVSMLHPRAAKYFFWRTVPRRVAVVFTGLLVFVLLLTMNYARGIGVTGMTASTGLYEQIYIYSGASAIMNLSVTLEGYVPSDPPAMGLYIGRAIFWHIVDRDLIFATRYLEGVNAGTYLIYGWADFRWLGFVVTPFMTGLLIMLYIRLAQTGAVAGLILGAIGMRALIFSSNSDVIFDQSTGVLMLFAVATWLFTREPVAAQAQPMWMSSTGRPPEPSRLSV
jgi:hypothetical protein